MKQIFFSKENQLIGNATDFRLNFHNSKRVNSPSTLKNNLLKSRAIMSGVKKIQFFDVGQHIGFGYVVFKSDLTKYYDGLVEACPKRPQHLVITIRSRQAE